MNGPIQFDQVLLGHGYVRYIEHWGSDERIIEAARMSTGKGFLGWGPKDCECAGTSIADGVIAKDWQTDCPVCKGTGNVSGDEKLLSYLYNNSHMTPFEMGGLIVEVQAPIFVFREWHRHRTASYNEMSARYTSLPNVNYIPTIDRLMMNAGSSNKQAGTVKDAAVMTLAAAARFQDDLRKSYDDSEALYQSALLAGVPKELARVHLPVGRFSRMRASANLRNWLQFLTLRDAPTAQWEIQQYARCVAVLIEERFSRTYDLYCKGRTT